MNRQGINRHYKFIRLLFLGALGFLVSCGNSPQSGVTDIGHSLAGVLLDTNGQPLRGALVVARRYHRQGDSLPSVQTEQVYTSESGSFELKNLADGYWVVVGQGQAEFVTGAWLMQGKNLQVDTMRIAPGVHLRGRVRDFAGNPARGRVWVPAARNPVQVLGNDGEFFLNGVPLGNPDICVQRGSQIDCLRISLATFADTIELLDLRKSSTQVPHPIGGGGGVGQMEPFPWPNDSLPLYYLGRDFSKVRYHTVDSAGICQPLSLQMPHSIALEINWSEAVPQEDLQNFPLPVRPTRWGVQSSLLTDTLWNFLDSNGAVLRHEIEHWNSLADCVVVWVSLPIIRANQQGVRLFMQQRQLEVQGGGLPVFDTTFGFAAVYHFAGAWTARAGDTIFDATNAGRHGVWQRGSDRQLQGLLGNWDIGESSFTASIRVRWLGENNENQILFSKRRTLVADSMHWQWYLDGTMGRFRLLGNNGPLSPGNVFTPRALTLDRWVQLVLTWNADTQLAQMWQDGEPLDGGFPFNPGPALDAPLRVAGSDGGERWNGIFDEARLERGVRSSSWIRMVTFAH